MNNNYKQSLREELKINFSEAKLTTDDLKQVKKDEREKFIETKLLEVNFVALQWALSKQIITEDDFENEPFIKENKKLNDVIINGGLATVGLGGAGIVFANATAPLFLGFGGGIGAIGGVAAAAIAAPIALTGLAAIGIYKYKENEAIKKLIEYFEEEKNKVLEFYIGKINNVQIKSNEYSEKRLENSDEKFKITIEKDNENSTDVNKINSNLKAINSFTRIILTILKNEELDLSSENILEIFPEIDSDDFKREFEKQKKKKRFQSIGPQTIKDSLIKMDSKEYHEKLFELAFTKNNISTLSEDLLFKIAKNLDITFEPNDLLKHKVKYFTFKDELSLVFYIDEKNFAIKDKDTIKDSNNGLDENNFFEKVPEILMEIWGNSDIEIYFIGNKEHKSKLQSSIDNWKKKESQIENNEKNTEILIVN